MPQKRRRNYAAAIAPCIVTRNDGESVRRTSGSDESTIAVTPTCSDVEGHSLTLGTPIPKLSYATFSVTRYRRRRSSATSQQGPKRQKRNGSTEGWLRAKLANDQVYDADCEDANDEDSDKDGNACLNQVDQKDTDDGGSGKDECISLDNTRTDSLPNPATPVQAQHQSLSLDALNIENKPDKHIGQRGVGYDDHGYAHGHPISEDEHGSSQPGDLSPPEHSSHPSKSGTTAMPLGPSLMTTTDLMLSSRGIPYSMSTRRTKTRTRTTERVTAKATTKG